MGSEEFQRQLAEMVKRDEERRRNEIIERHKQFFIEFATATFDKAAVYTTVVIAAGYAGFFTIWGWIKDYLLQWEMLTTALLIGFSLLAFVCWEIYVMWLLSRRGVKNAVLITTPNADFEQVAEQDKVGGHAEAQRLMHIWPIVFWLTTGPGILGGIILLLATGRHLVCG